MKNRNGLIVNRLPLAIRFISVVMFVSTFIAIVAGLSLLWPGAIFDILWKLNPTAQTEFAMDGRLVGLLFLCLGIMTSTANIGLRKGKTWAWWLTLLLLVVVGAVNFIRLLAGDPGEFFGTPLTFGLLWFHIKHVRKSFISGRAPRPG